MFLFGPIQYFLLFLLFIEILRFIKCDQLSQSPEVGFGEKHKVQGKNIQNSSALKSTGSSTNIWWPCQKQPGPLITESSHTLTFYAPLNHSSHSSSDIPGRGLVCWPLDHQHHIIPHNWSESSSSHMLGKKGSILLKPLKYFIYFWVCFISTSRTYLVGS